MFKTEEMWKRADLNNTLEELKEKFKKEEKLTKFELKIIAEWLGLPKGVCLCQNKHDGSVVMDYSKCNFLDRYFLDSCLRKNGVPDCDEKIKDVCNGTYVKV